MFWNKRKVKESLIEYKRQIEYEGHVITVYVRQLPIDSRDLRLTFKVGWQVDDAYGEYSHYHSESVSSMIFDCVEKAKKYVDKLNNIPKDIEKAKQILNSL